MEPEGTRSGSRKRKRVAREPPEAPDHEAGMEDQEPPPPAEVPNPEAGTEDQEPPLPVEDGDRISHLPDGVLGDIITLLPTDEGARTQVLASRWRTLWPSAPLNMDFNYLCKNATCLDAALVRRLLSTHTGPARRFCAPVYHLHASTVDAWLRSPTLDNIQELQLYSLDPRLRPPSPPELPPAAFRFRNTLRVAVIEDCHLPDSTAAAQALDFPMLTQLALRRVRVSESSLHAIIAGCPALECLLIRGCSGFRRLRINSATIRSIGCNAYAPDRGLQLRDLVIENAPCLERLLQLGSDPPHTSVISAPKLHTICCLLCDSGTRLVIGSTVIQGMRVDSLTTSLQTVKLLSVDLGALCLDFVIDLMRCFPCLERLYIECFGPANTNLWRRKHRDFIRSSDIRLKTISWRRYRRIKSHVDFATFFLLNATLLELMILTVNQIDYKERFFVQQREMLQLDSKASRSARVRFTQYWAHPSAEVYWLHHLDLADPFQRRDPYEFHELS